RRRAPRRRPRAGGRGRVARSARGPLPRGHRQLHLCPQPREHRGLAAGAAGVSADPAEPHARCLDQFRARFLGPLRARERGGAGEPLRRAVRARHRAAEPRGRDHAGVLRAALARCAARGAGERDPRAARVARYRPGAPRRGPGERARRAPGARRALRRARAKARRGEKSRARRAPARAAHGQDGSQARLRRALRTAASAGAAARVDQATARREQAVAGYQRAVETGFREVADALVNVEQSGDSEAELKQRLDAARAALELSTLRYEKGYSPYLEVLDAQRNANDAELAYVRNRQARLAFSVDLMKALGGGWNSGTEPELRKQR